MKYFNPLLIGVLLVCSLSLWGCTNQKTGAISVKVRELETRYAKLEEDYHTLQNTHDQNRKKLTESESQRAALDKDKTDLAKQLETSTSESEELRKQVAQRTAERDTAQTNLRQFGKDLQALAGRVETVLNHSPQNPNLTIVPASRRTD
jgi:chromosome segregation ATPase